MIQRCGETELCECHRTLLAGSTKRVKDVEDGFVAIVASSALDISNVGYVTFKQRRSKKIYE